MGQPARESRRYEFPPLWSVPVLLLVAITVAVYLGFAFGFLGFLVALVGVWWLERKTDAYVRRRESARD
jgi:uncharacterized protein (DUF58 family)